MAGDRRGRATGRDPPRGRRLAGGEDHPRWRALDQPGAEQLGEQERARADRERARDLGIEADDLDESGFDY